MEISSPGSFYTGSDARQVPLKDHFEQASTLGAPWESLLLSIDFMKETRFLAYARWLDAQLRCLLPMNPLDMFSIILLNLSVLNLILFPWVCHGAADTSGMTISYGWGKRYALNQTFCIDHRFQSEKTSGVPHILLIVFNSRQGPSWETCSCSHRFHQFQYYTSWYANKRCKGIWISSPVTKVNCLFKKNKTPHCVQLFLISSKVRQSITFL